MSWQIFQVDAFTDRPFSGNPAAVVLLKDAQPEKWMQQVAQEMNLAETAFLLPRMEGYDLRWFTPRAEVDLCGHATLASAHVLWEMAALSERDAARFHTRSGWLQALKDGDCIELDFPTEPAETVEPPDVLLPALGVAVRYVGRNRMDYLVEVESEEVLRSLQPDLQRLAALQHRGVMVTSRSATGEFDFVSRFFAPGIGIDEDPVTGSAHCCLGPYWTEKLGKREMVAYQASPRGGTVTVRVGDGRVYLRGRAVTVLRGELL